VYDAFEWPEQVLGSAKSLRDFLIPLTVQRAAARVPFYQNLWGDSWRAVRSEQDLSLLPVLTKEEAVQHQESLLASGASAFVGVISSGTMHGDRRLLRVPHAPPEAEALAHFARAWAAAHPSSASGRGEGEAAGLMLELRAMHHGLPERPPPPDVLRIPWTFTSNALRLAHELLARPQADGRWVTGMVLGSGALMPLTAWFLEKGVNPAEFRVREIGTHGFRLSRAWRKLVERAWQAEVYDNFSLSEFATPALECKRCGFNHWLWPPLAFEVLDAARRVPVREGTGALILTNLYPFAQAMPLIRYWTGDLVELGPTCSQSEDRGIRFRGRITRSILRDGIEGEPILVTPTDVEDFLDERPEVARIPHPVQTLGLVKSPDTGIVKYDLTWREEPKPAARVRVELRFDPLLFSDAAGRLALELANHLLERSPRLRKFEESGEGELQVEVVPPGTLVTQWSKF
jgi:hypothetical protein